MSSKNTNKKKASKKQLSVSEFKIWLDGYCLSHDDNWAPSTEQWKMIKDKIFALVETDIKPEQPPVRNMLPPQPNFLPRGPVMLPPSNFMQPQSGMNEHPQQSMVGITNTPPLIKTSTGALKTPDKDSSGTSDFA
jgi:hypothetical protein